MGLRATECSENRCRGGTGSAAGKEGGWEGVELLCDVSKPGVLHLWGMTPHDPFIGVTHQIFIIHNSSKSSYEVATFVILWLGATTP